MLTTLLGDNPGETAMDDYELRQVGSASPERFVGNSKFGKPKNHVSFKREPIADEID